MELISSVGRLEGTLLGVDDFGEEVAGEVCLEAVAVIADTMLNEKGRR